MDNRKYESFDQRFLAPLKNRPDIDPDEKFVEKLRTEITEGQNQLKQNIKPKWQWPILVPMAMTVIIFSVLAASFIGVNTNQEDSKVADKKEVISEDHDKDENGNEKERNIDQLIANNDAYQTIYQQVFKVVGAPTPGKELIYYFDALKKGDQDYLKEKLIFEFYDQPVEEVIKYYQNADFSTLALETINRDENDTILNVSYSFTDAETGMKVRRRLLIQNWDSKDLKISDAVSPADLNEEKDQLVKEKVEFIEHAFKIGLSKEAAKEIFGSEFTEIENSDAEDGTKKYWTYQYLVEPGTTSDLDQDFMVDFPNLINQKIGVLFSIGWSSENKALKMSIFYTQKGKVMIKTLRPDGTMNEVEQKAGEIIYDTTAFRLTEEEKTAYNWFKVDHDLDNLKNLSPISIAKLYVQADLEGDAETEYAFYTTRPEYVMWSQEEHIKFSESDRTTAAQKLSALGGIQNGKFVETSDFEGYISFENANGSQGFRMIKDPDGIWKVAFMAIQ
ncbi:hypothetical protein AABM38_12615 [Heyndrickxia sp. MSNUG]|uniref:hypothetical protein n=1 Tax=Heyndrickxia sp. MSNUG TaxID=3136677 RepID=UPI003C2EF57D